MGKIVLIDGHSILTRAFFGIPDLTSPDGRHTNAVYGFLNILFRILDEEAPTHITVAFDRKAPTFRHEMYKEYKGTRKPMPPELHEQVPLIKEVLTSMGILIMEKDGYEADDILGTIAGLGEKEGLDVCLVSGDRDLLQIATDKIKVRIPKTKAGGTVIEDYYADDVKSLYGVSGQGFIELKALMGDSSDNIPGVPKVGEKTAMDLMKSYGSLDGIYENIESITKKAIKASLIENRHLAELSLKLATICTSADIDYNVNDAQTGSLFTPEAYRLFKELGFKNMLSRFSFEEGDDADTAPVVESLTDIKEFDSLFEGISAKFESITAKSESVTVTDDGILGISILMEDASDPLFMGVSHNGKTSVLSGKDLTPDYIGKCLHDMWERGITLSTGTAGIIYPYTDFLKSASDEVMDRVFDINLAAYMLNPLKSDYCYEDVASEYLGLSVPGIKESIGKKSLYMAKTEDFDILVKIAGYFALTASKAAPILKDKLLDAGMYELYQKTEIPLSYILYDMEKEGIMVDKKALSEYGDALSGRIAELEKSIHDAAGEVFNINSPKQLGEILFGKLGLKGGKKTKTGYSTAADVLEKLSEEYEIAKDILEYRGLAKLKSTYADGLIDYIGTDNRIHTHFNQTITATGRLSSSDPNLQNIPMRTELGRRIRRVFIPKEGCIFTDSDYSQIELRLLAHMSGDEALIEAYREEADIHRITASKVFKTPFEEVTDLQRRNAKAVNFGIVYGISSFGLSQDLSISKKEAESYIKEYFATYPGIKAFLDGCVASAKERGYAVTLYGRRRPVPELKNSNFMQRSFGERVAMNAPIQGTAADIMKFAMVKVYRALYDEGLRSKLILQIHDELLIETFEDEADKVKDILNTQMEAAAELSVRLETDLHTGRDWYEAK